MNKDNCLVAVNDLYVTRGADTVLQQISFCIEAGRHLALVGPSGSGKTTLLQVLAGQVFARGEISFQQGMRRVLVQQQHRFANLAHTTDFYYQQRFNAADAADAPTPAAAFPQLFTKMGMPAVVQNMVRLFNIEELKHRPMIQLSNGENKRLQLAQALLQQPHLLLLDNPFTGLDAASRNQLEQTLATLGNQGVTVVLTCPPNRIPRFVTGVLELKGNAGAEIFPAAQYYPAEIKNEPALIPPNAALQPQIPHFTYAVQMRQVHIQYGEKQVLHNINWEIKRGEHWLLWGPNGAGKSTLLSLITADNPQAYANEVYLFGKRRGTGESIWDVKRNIGYVSPELHLYFDAGATVFDTVASGLFDTIGLFRQLSPSDQQMADQWLHFLQMAHVKNKLLQHLPLGQQRLVLLARALIKNPPLLVLDEPLQGMDEHQIRFFNGIVDALCNATAQTLIFVSHYNDELPRCLTRRLKLEAGTIVECV